MNINKIYKSVALVLVSFSIGIKTYGQEVDSLRLALNDEMKRNISKLKSKEFDDPFYISYTAKDYQTFVVSASLGGILSLDNNHLRTSNTRVLVGGYDFNDESLFENSVEPYYSADDMEIPLEDDYEGIRRALWLSTDKVYKTAGEIFNRHKAELKEKGKKIDEVPHLKFYKAKPVKITDLQYNVSLDFDALESRVVKLSKYFLKYPELTISNITLTAQKEVSYFVNSEGSDVKMDDLIVTLFIRAALQNEDGSYAFDQKRFVNDNASELFEENNFEKVIDEMYASILEKQKAPRMDDSYEGPVLFLGEVVTDVFTNVLQQFSPNPPKTEDSEFGSEYEDVNALENKIGKKVMSSDITISLKPSLKTFNNQKLLGSFQINDEGIVPSENVVLVENGVVKNLMTNRNYKQKEFIPNGTGQSPGVIDVEIKSKYNSLEDLKKHFIEILKEEELEYGLIVRESPNMRMLEVYKLYLDGREELFTHANMEEIDLKTLRKIEGCTQERIVYNKPVSNGIISYIIPSAILLEELEIEPMRMAPYKMDLPLVDNPMKAISEEN